MRLLVVVDMQNDFIDGALGFEEASEIVPLIKQKVEEYLQEDQLVLFTQDTHFNESRIEINYSSTREGKHLPIEHCISKTEGWKIHKQFKPYLLGCFVYTKYNRFGISHYDLEQLRNVQTRLCTETIDEIEIVGLVTNICVISCAISLQNYFNNAEITIDASCCRSNNKELHEKALDVMEGLQMKIINR
jgi:nicotinamidase-related amidase